MLNMIQKGESAGFTAWALITAAPAMLATCRCGRIRRARIRFVDKGAQAARSTRSSR
jgi:hypothetical protein